MVFSTKSNRLITSVWYCASGYWYGRNKWNWACQKVTSRKWKHCDYLHYEFHSVCSRGFEVQAFRYLLKADFSAKLDSYFDSAVQEVLQRKQLVTISINSEIIDVPVNDILYLESHRRIIVMHLLDEKRPAYQFYGNITELSEKIEPLGFLRIQKSYLVNMHYVEIFQYNKVQLRGGLCLAPSENSYNELKQKYLHWRGKSRWML